MLKSTGSMVGLITTSKKAFAKEYLLRLLLPGVPTAQLLALASTEDPPTLADRSGSVSCGITAPFPWVLVYARFCLCPPREESVSPSAVDVL